MKTVFLLLLFMLSLFAVEPYPCDAPLDVNSTRECLQKQFADQNVSVEAYPCDAPLDVNSTRECLEKDSVDQNVSLEEAVDDAITEINIDEETDSAVKIADDGNASGFEPYLLHLDVFHEYFSHKVHVVSCNIDTTLADMLDSFDNNETEAEEKRQKKAEQSKEPEEMASEDMSERFNKFFNDKTYLDANNLSFLMFRLGYRFNKEEGNEFLNKIRFSLKLPKTGDRFNLFFGDSDEEVNTFNTEGQANENATLGLRYFMPTKIDGLKSSFSAGIRGLDNPYVRARFEYPLNYDDLYIRPIQYFRYSYKEEFEEKTDLFFDYKSAERQMIRLHLQRETVYDQPGMLFYAGLIHLHSFSKDEGLQTYISLGGATKNDIDPALVDYEPETGINSYSVGALWRQRIFRKYIFFEIQPLVNFAQRYHYTANPILEFNVELYFGNI